MATQTLDADAIAGLKRIRSEPAAFIRDWMGVDLWDKQIEIAEAVRDHRRVAVKSCHSSGKSFLSARLVLWFLHAFPGSVVITTAPTANQVENILWRELRAAFSASKRPLLGRPLTTRVEIAPDWYALGFKADDAAPDRFQGFHAEYILIVVDEAAGVVGRVYEALDAIMTSEHARMLLIGNPTNPTGQFYNAFHASRSIYHTITIAAADTPNIQAGQVVRPYLITQQWVNEAIEEHGEASPYVQSRVYAEFPSIGTNVLIPLAWIDHANNNRADEKETEAAELEAGLDVAYTGEDENALCVRRGAQVIAEYAWSGMDTMQSVGRVREILADYPTLSALKVDIIGYGAGVGNRLRELGYPVYDINVGSRSSDPEQFRNLRCELWWMIRERFREQRIAGPLNERTIAQLADIRYKYDSSHTKPVIESKPDAKKRGVKSPDRADAVLLAFMTPPIVTTFDNPWRKLATGGARGRHR